jgi:UPF0716 protein FxsA
MVLLILLFFFCLPFIEIAVFIEIVGLVGLSLALLLVIAGAVGGLILLRHQGFAVLRSAEATVGRGEVPVDAVIHGLFLLAAAMFFLIPGFVTDLLAFLLLVPDLRLKLGKAFLSAAAQRARNTRERRRGGPVIEADYEDRTPSQRR